MTLHVGLGTFRPVKVEDVTEHHMHSEFYIVEPEQAELINRVQKKKAGRLWQSERQAAVRWSRQPMKTVILKAGSGWTDILYLSWLSV